MPTETATSVPATTPVLVRARWTGGQYSLFRVLLAVYLCATFVQLLPVADKLAAAVRNTSHPITSAFPSVFELRLDRPVVLSAIGAGAILCIPLAIGWNDRLAAVSIWYLWACLYVQSPEIVGKALPTMGWVLLAHVCIPPAPFGSFEARGRPDPRGGWQMPAGIPIAVWGLLIVMHGYFAWVALRHAAWRDGTAVGNLLRSSYARDSLLVDAAQALPAGVLAVASWLVIAIHLSASLAAFHRLRPLVWMLLVVGQCFSLVFLSQTEYALGMLLVLGLACDPGWIRPTRLTDGTTDWLFYDGDCGLCHRTIRLVLAEEPGQTIRFAPLGSEAFLNELSDEQRANLPDSVVVKTGDQLLVRSRAALYVLRRLGGGWRVLGELGRVVPRRVADMLYDFVAAVRKRVFVRPKQACPLLPPDLRERFELS